MSATISLRRVSLLAAVLAALPLASNQLVGTVTMQLQPPTFAAIDSRRTDGEVAIVFHGIWDGPSRMNPLLSILHDSGPVLMVGNGSNVSQTPNAIIKELRARGWLHRHLHVVGFSLGTQLAVRFMRKMRDKIGRPVRRATLISGPARASDVIWPNWYVPWLVRVVQPGPIVSFGWKRYWRAQVRNAKALPPGSGRNRSIQAAQWNLARHAGIGITSARMLAHGPHLKPGEFNATDVLIIEHSVDGLIRTCIDGWRVAAPQARYELIPTPGHGDFRENLAIYRRAMTPRFTHA